VAGGRRSRSAAAEAALRGPGGPREAFALVWIWIGEGRIDAPDEFVELALLAAGVRT